MRSHAGRVKAINLSVRSPAFRRKTDRKEPAEAGTTNSVSRCEILKLMTLTRSVGTIVRQALHSILFVSGLCVETIHNAVARCRLR